MPSYRVTVDTGGTFSDFVYFDEETKAISIAKLPSTPDDPSRAILSGIELLLDNGIAPSAISYFCHGTTVGTNALLEGKTVRTALLVTKGFRGIYEVAEQCRPHGSAIFDIFYDRPPPLVPPALTGEVVERVSATGEILQPLDEAALKLVIRELAAQSPQSIAVCLLFSFLQPEHEQRVRAVIAREMPGCAVSLSSEILPQIREYYRLSTTVINACLQPILARYLENLETRLATAGIASHRKYVMQSNGGMANFATSATKAVATVLSGPAGGVTASVEMSRAMGLPNLVTFDMGGTSCDVALIRNGEPAMQHRGKIEGRDISLPMLDIHTVSAGGGTLARVDRFGQLVVGPDSAGAVPGPACYGRGGTEPAITDCNLVLGYLSEGNFLGGNMKLHTAAAHRAVEAKIAAKLGLDAFEAAEGMIRIINVKMQEAIKSISTMRGHDLREFHLLAFGGAGPLHAGAIAAELGMAGIVVPLYPGVHSAMGLLMSDVKHDYIRSRMIALDRITPDEMRSAFGELESQAVRDLRDEGFPAASIALERSLDLRYAGQGYELTIPCGGNLERDGIARLREAFDETHRQSFGHVAPGETVEIVSFRVCGIGRLPPVGFPKFRNEGRSLSEARREQRRARFGGVMLDCAVYQRERLDVGHVFGGPAIVDQLDATTLVAPGQTARVDEFRNLVIGIGK